MSTHSVYFMPPVLKAAVGHIAFRHDVMSVSVYVRSITRI